QPAAGRLRPDRTPRTGPPGHRPMTRVTPVRSQSLISNETRDRIRGLARPVALGLGRLGLTPNALTVTGFAGTALAAAAAAAQWWLAAGILVIAFGIFDMFDGALAGATNR